MEHTHMNDYYKNTKGKSDPAPNTNEIVTVWDCVHCGEKEIISPWENRVEPTELVCWTCSKSSKYAEVHCAFLDRIREEQGK